MVENSRLLQGSDARVHELQSGVQLILNVFLSICAAEEGQQSEKSNLTTISNSQVEAEQRLGVCKTPVSLGFVSAQSQWNCIRFAWALHEICVSRPEPEHRLDHMITGGVVYSTQEPEWKIMLAMDVKFDWEICK